MKDQIDCKAAEAAMPDLLFDPGAAGPALSTASGLGCGSAMFRLAQLLPGLR